MGKRNYSVNIPSAFYLVYREGGKTMQINIDMRDFVPVLYASEIHRWLPPHESEPILPADKQRIINNIARYFCEDRHFRLEVADKE